jgi:hypothetical protein
MGMSTSVRFIRRTSFQPDEQHINFTKLDNDILDVITSPEACEICPSITRVYLRLLRTPSRYWEREGVLYFNGEEGEFGYRTAWQQLINITGVGNTTLSKSLRFLHDSGVIGYSAKAAGAGIRIFFNHAQASIKKRTQKNLRLVSTPAERTGNPETGAAFNGIHLQEVQDNDFRTFVRTSPFTAKQALPGLLGREVSPTSSTEMIAPSSTFPPSLETSPFPLEQIQVLPELRITDSLQTLQDWLNDKAIPKATRIAIKESLNWLKAQGVIHKPDRHLEQEKVYRTSNSPAQNRDSYDATTHQEAESLLHTLSSQQKHRWANILAAEIAKQTRSNQLEYWDEQTWRDTIHATMRLQLKAALHTINYCCQRPSSQSLAAEDLNELSRAYSLFSNLFEKDVNEIIWDDLKAGKLTPAIAQELIKHCQSEPIQKFVINDQ